MQNGVNRAKALHKGIFQRKFCFTSLILSVTSFFQDNFGIDDYLSKCTQKSDLLTLKNDLKSYGSELQSQMVGILKTETEEIINLAENLANLNSEIQDLYTPLTQLTGEVEVIIAFEKAKDLFCFFRWSLKPLKTQRLSLGANWNRSTR